MIRAFVIHVTYLFDACENSCFFFLLIDQFKFNSHRQHCLLMINIVCIESNCRKFKTGLIKKTEKNCDAKHRTNKLFQYCQKRKTYNKSLLYFFFSNYYYYLNCCHFTTNHCKFFCNYYYYWNCCNFTTNHS